MTAVLHYVGGPTGPFDETVAGETVKPGYVELTRHATFCPLAPGDVVKVSRGLQVVAVRSLVPLWTVEATLHLPRGTTFGQAPGEDHPAMLAVAEVQEEWTRAAWVTRNTSFSFLVSAQTRGWLEDNVEAHPYVEHVELRRTPEMRTDLGYWLAHPDF